MQVRTTTRFEKDLKRVARRNKDLTNYGQWWNGS